MFPSSSRLAEINSMENQDTKPKIECKGLWKIFGPNPTKIVNDWDDYKDLSKTELVKKTSCVVGVRNINLSVRTGEIFVIMGLSGSGKSTLLRCINLLHKPTAGSVVIDGEDITKLSTASLRNLRRQKIGMVFQHFALLPHRRVIDNVAYGLEVRGIDKNKRYEKAREMLELVGLQGWERQFPHELSGGMQQRVGLARALATNPEILLMDEAFSALDPLIRRQMQDEFIRLLKVVNKTIVFVTHDLHEALRIATKIAIMRAGVVEQIGTPAEIVLNPKTTYVAEFVKDLPKAKFVTAGDIMEPAEKWTMPVNSTVDQIINKMDIEGLWYAYVVDEHQRIKGVIDYRNLSNGNGKLREDMIEGSYPSKSQQTFLEELIKMAAKTSIPIAITDDSNRLVGVVTRERLLSTLSS